MAVPKNLNLIGPQLQKLRKERHWSQRELSEKLRSMGWHITRDILAQMEVTQKRITDCDLIFLAKALNVSVTDFFPSTFTPETAHTKIQSRRSRIWHPALSQSPSLSAAKTFLSKMAYFLRRRIFKSG